MVIKCQKCSKEFDEKDIHLSHDIPKYMGGTDADGRHNLCFECHQRYELEVLKVGLMGWIKIQHETTKAHFRKSARLVKSYYFKENKK